MNPPDELREVLAEGLAVRLAGEGIYSVLHDAPHAHLYDRRAAVYDAVVGTRLYNRAMWGASPLDYEAFARRAVASGGPGLLLDAGCGSMLFTARAYLESGRRVVAFDQSLRMLRRARARLLGLAGRVPDNVTLLQADLGDLPFRRAAFQTVLCMNVLHQFADAGVLIPGLKTLLADGGRLFLTSLVSTGRAVGDRYLRALYRAGEFVRPRTSAELRELLGGALGEGVSYRTQGNMAYAATAASA